jgi:hypothetical protein
MFQPLSQPTAPRTTVGEDDKLANENTVQFVQGSWSQNSESKGPSKLYHKKSRNGCRRYKARRVKVTSPILFIFFLLFWNYKYRNFLFPNFWEIINSGTVLLLSGLFSHSASLLIEEYVEHQNRQLTYGFIVNSVIKSILLAETA